jgi:hypothetical protein
MNMSPLFMLTRDLHHACENHPIGQIMVDGSIAPQQWADWLWSFRCLHQVVDVMLPAHMERDMLLNADLSVLPKANPSKRALEFAASLVGHDVHGAAYVLHGAHRSGGRVIAPKMAKRGFPTSHTTYREPELVKEWIEKVKQNADYADQAIATFTCLLGVMDEIQASL